jgi:Domain of unknown function (DUF4062)
LARVYVSSTIVDLTEERRAVLDWLRLARHQAVDSCLPDSDTVRDSCLDDVAACDLYVLILGHRYGSQPADDNPEGLSITQLEFRQAGECGIPRVALLRTSIPDVSLSDRGDPVAAVHGTLAATPLPWLLIFDNAPDRVSVAQFLPPAGAGRVLITSRDQIWPPGQALDVPVLDPQVAAGFLVSRTGDPDRRAALGWPVSWAGCRWH